MLSVTGMTWLWLAVAAYAVALLCIYALCRAGADDNEHTGPRP